MPDGPTTEKDPPTGTVDELGIWSSSAGRTSCRMDQRFKRRAEWVSPERVEEALVGCPGVREALVLPERRGDEDAPVAWVVGEALDPAAVRRWMMTRVQPWDVPVEVHVVPSLARTGMGKIARVRPG